MAYVFSAYVFSAYVFSTRTSFSAMMTYNHKWPYKNLCVSFLYEAQINYAAANH